MRTKNRYLKRRRRWWHYQRRVPGGIAAVSGKHVIEFALKTMSVEEARSRRDDLNRVLERQWRKSAPNPAKLDTASVAGARDEEALAYADHLQWMADPRENAPRPDDYWMELVEDHAAKLATEVTRPIWTRQRTGSPRRRG